MWKMPSNTVPLDWDSKTLWPTNVRLKWRSLSRWIVAIEDPFAPLPLPSTVEGEDDAPALVPLPGTSPSPGGGPGVGFGWSGLAHALAGLGAFTCAFPFETAVSDLTIIGGTSFIVRILIVRVTFAE